MDRVTLLSISLFALVSGVLCQTAPAYGQVCNSTRSSHTLLNVAVWGTGWTGATTCASGYTCTYSNEWNCHGGAHEHRSQSGTATTTASGGSTTLQPGYSFIRAVEDPNFHKYLRSEVEFTASQAVLGEPSEAAQFQITGGQLIQNANGTPLYAVWDTVEWSSPNITRPQNNAWLVCPDADGNLDLYVNLGAYAYQTPAGCADETIHAYTGSTATA
ncbi:hypothetical protein CPB85DRAFT_1374516 [Mucidula mucida]|nr:hypothetical protein CPB85DRAFT_1374516 [Mucidula mucida]